MAQKKEFCVIEFTKTDTEKCLPTIQVVPKIWIKNIEGQNFILWPPHDKGVGKLIKKVSDPKSNWKEFLIQKIHYETDDFNQALKREKKLSENTEAEDTDLEKEKATRSSRKRKRIITSESSSSSSSSDDSDEDGKKNKKIPEERNVLPPQPPLPSSRPPCLSISSKTNDSTRGIVTASSASVKLTTTSSVQNVSLTSPKSLAITTAADELADEATPRATHDKESENNNGVIAQDGSVATTSSTPTDEERKMLNNSVNNGNSGATSLRPPDASDPVPKNKCNDDEPLPKWVRLIVDGLAEIKVELKDVKRSSKSCGRSCGTSSGSARYHYLDPQKDFPFRTLEEFQTMNENLNGNSLYLREMKDYLTTLLQTNRHKAVWQMLTKVISNDLGMQFSMQGNSSEKPNALEPTKLWNTIEEIVTNDTYGVKKAKKSGERWLVGRKKRIDDLKDQAKRKKKMEEKRQKRQSGEKNEKKTKKKKKDNSSDSGSDCD